MDKISQSTFTSMRHPLGGLTKSRATHSSKVANCSGKIEKRPIVVECAEGELCGVTTVMSQGSVSLVMGRFEE